MANDYLSSLQGAWQNATAPERAELPDGDYQVRLESAQIKSGRVTGDPFLAYELRILSGRYANHTMVKMQRLVPESLPYLKADLELLQICPDDISKLEEVLPFALDAILEVRQKTGAKRDGSPAKNIYFNKLVRQGRTASQTSIPDGFTQVDDSDLPWEK